MKCCFALLCGLVLAGAVQAQCPSAIDTWSTTNGTMLGGRASEAWCGVPPYPLQPGVPGNTQNAMSWNGTALGTQWKAWGMSINAAGAVLLSDLVDANGNGSRTYGTHYDGGQFWLSASNTWSDGVSDLTGMLTSYYVVITITYVNFNAVGATSNITFTGTFDNCPATNDCEITFTIANAFLIWGSGQATPMPPNYPSFLCGATLGQLFDICCISMNINCAVTDVPTSWGSLKSLYR